MNRVEETGKYLLYTVTVPEPALIADSFDCINEMMKSDEVAIAKLTDYIQKSGIEVYERREAVCLDDNFDLNFWIHPEDQQQLHDSLEECRLRFYGLLPSTPEVIKPTPNTIEAKATILGSAKQSLRQLLRRTLSKWIGCWVVFACALPSAQAQMMDGALLFEKCIQGAVAIYTPYGQGSGFVVNAVGGYVVTNHHVIEGFERYPQHILIKFADGSEVWTTSVVKYDAKIDLALLKANLPAQAIALPVLGAGLPALGSEMATIGTPQGIEFSFNKGTVSNLDPTSQYPHIFQTDVAINGGNSGGPLINKNGQVVGIVVAKWVGIDLEGLNYGIKGSYLLDFLLGSGATYSTAKLIEDTQLKEARQLTEEEKLKQKELELLRIEKEKALLLQKAQQDQELARIQAENQKKLEAERLQRSKEDIALQKERERLAVEEKKRQLAQTEQRAKDQKKKDRAKLPPRLSLQIGGGIQNLQSALSASSTTNLGNASNRFDNQWQAQMQGALLYRIGFFKTKKEKIRASTLGLFTTYGFLASTTASQYAQVNNLPLNASDLKSFHPYWEWELGTTYKEWLRLSTGIGSQAFDRQNGQITVQNYYTSTLGLLWPLGVVDIGLQLTGLYGGFLAQPAFRTSFVLQFNLKFGKW